MKKTIKDPKSNSGSDPGKQYLSNIAILTLGESESYVESGRNRDLSFIFSLIVYRKMCLAKG